MALEAPNWYTTQYDQRVRHLIQNKGFLLRGATNAPVEVNGSKLKFFFIGKAEAQKRQQVAELVKGANLGKSTKEVDMEDWQFAEFIPHGEPDKINPEYRSKVQEAGAMALGRRFDRIIMEAMDAETTNIATLGDGSVALSPVNTSQAKAKISEKGTLEQNQFYVPLPSMQFEQLKLYKVFNNRDYTGDNLAFKSAGMINWNSINYFEAPNDMFTAYDAHSVDTYLWHKEYVGFGSNYSLNTKITYENLYTSWLYNMVMSGAAKVLQTDGVYRLRYKIDADLTIDGA